MSYPSQAAGILPLVWRPWSLFPGRETVRRKVCGLLNKLTTHNSESTFTQIVQCSISCEKYGSTDLLSMIADSVLRAAIVDEPRSSLYAELCQKIETESNKETIRLSLINHSSQPSFHHIFTTTIRDSCNREFECTRKTNTPQLLSLMRFMGDLLRIGILSTGDVQVPIDTLFLGAENGDEDGTIAICRFLRPISQWADGLHLMKELDVFSRIKSVLEEDTISFRIRFLLMAVAEPTNERPVDVFDSARQRTEIYGFDSEDDAYVSSQEDDIFSVTGYAETYNEISQLCVENVRSFFASRDLGFGDDFVQSLPAEHRYVLIEHLVREAAVSGHADNASLVASLFSLSSVRRLCIPSEAFYDGFLPVIEMLEDAILDNPDAYRFVARMLQACTLRADLVEMLASSIRGQECCKKLFLDQYFALFNRLHPSGEERR